MDQCQETANIPGTTDIGCNIRPSWLLCYQWFGHLPFGLGRGPITPPGPAMVRTDLEDLNSNKTKQNIGYNVTDQTEHITP